jgi:hypothetical protein
LTTLYAKWRRFFKEEMYSEVLFLAEVESGSIPRKEIDNLGCLLNIKKGGEPSGLMPRRIVTMD